MNIVADGSAVETHGQSRFLIADCDIHPARKSPKDLYPYLERRWQEQMDLFGPRQRQPYGTGPAYPKSQPNAARRDAWPPGGGKPGSDLGFLREQLLDRYGIGFGLLNPVGDNGQSYQNQEFGAAVCRAVNDWQVAEWTSKERRLKASIVVPYENASAAVSEIERLADHSDFVQVILQSRSAEPLGQRRYWPIYEAASKAGLPVAIHAFGFGGNQTTGSGWPSFYMEDMVGHAQSCMSLLTSLVIEGVFERFPALKIVLIESGFGWLPAFRWRLDRVWHRLRVETPHLKRSPSEYIRDHVWFTSQPMEDTDKPAQLIDVIEWIGWDRLMFATDYPHWDFDDPVRVLPPGIDEEKRVRFFRENALGFYGCN